MHANFAGPGVDLSMCHEHNVSPSSESMAKVSTAIRQNPPSPNTIRTRNPDPNTLDISASLTQPLPEENIRITLNGWQTQMHTLETRAKLDTYHLYATDNKQSDLVVSWQTWGYRRLKMGPAASQSLRWQISGGLLNLNLTPRPLSNSSAIHSSSHPVCPGCLLPNNDASRKTEIEPLVQTSSRVVFSLCPGSLSFSAPSLLVSQSITASGLRQQCVGSLDF